MTTQISLDETVLFEQQLQVLFNKVTTMNGGFTVDPYTLEITAYNYGYTVQLAKHTVTTTSVEKSVIDKIILELRRTAIELGNKNLTIGGLQFQDHIVVDISKVIKSKKTAIKVGKDNKQKLIYDNVLGTTILLSDYNQSSKPLKVITLDEWWELVDSLVASDPEYIGEEGLLRAYDEYDPEDFGYLIKENKLKEKNEKN